MPTALIACGVIVLVGIVFVVMSRENWRWQNITLVTLFLLLGTLFFFLAAKNLRIQQGWRSEIAKFELEVNQEEKKIEQLREGKYDAAEHQWIEPSLAEWRRRVETAMQGRGRIWFQAQDVNVGADGTLQVKVEPAAHGILEKTILFVFDALPADKGGQFVGEFEVAKVNGQDLALAPVLPLLPNDSKRLAQRKNRSLWLYEIMPTDSYDLYAELAPAQRMALFSADVPNDVKQQFAKDGAAPDGSETDASHVWRRVKALKSFEVSIGAGEKAESVTVPEGAELILDPKSAEERIAAGDVAPVEGNDKVYRRSLRDYLRQYRDLNLSIGAQLRKIGETSGELAIVQEAKKKVDADLAFRSQEKKLLTSDKARFVAESERVKAHVKALEEELQAIGVKLRDVYEDNLRLEKELTRISYALASKLRGDTAAAGSK
ncbi:MAG: hypothetical protein IT427_12315 [Pirellulales bacterium]|nr:hypothetical protein [Pirellulales bacterium]